MTEPGNSRSYNKPTLRMAKMPDNSAEGLKKEMAALGEEKTMLAMSCGTVEELQL